MSAYDRACLVRARAARDANIDVLYRELMRRDLEGEDVSSLRVNETTMRIEPVRGYQVDDDADRDERRYAEPML